MLGFDFEGANNINRLATDFEVISQIGSGGFSSVYRVRNKLDRKQYALKIVKIKPSSYKSDIFDYIEKVVGEAKILSALSHPNILRYHGCWIDGEVAEQPSNQNSPVEEDESFEMDIYIEQSQNSNGIGFEIDTHQEKKQISSTQQIIELSEQSIFASKMSKYKQIHVYILSELAETSLQKYISQRNKNLSRNFDKNTNKYTNIETQTCSYTSQLIEKSIRIENYQFILDIVQSLMYIHDQKIIHRDIKLQNIIIDKNKRCKLIDFGLAKKIRAMKSIQLDRWFNEESRSEEGEFIQYEYEDSQDDEDDDDEKKNQKHSISVGTKIFSSPEQTSSDTYDYRTDIYSLAMAIALMFSHPSTVHQQRQLLHQIRNKKLQKLKIDPKLKQLLERCLSEQKLRPELLQIKNCIKKLLKQQFFRTQNERIPTRNNLSKFRESKRQPLIQNFNLKHQFNQLIPQDNKYEKIQESLAVRN